VAKTVQVKFTGPKYVPSQEGFRVRNTELCGSVGASLLTTFEILTRKRLNPGSQNTFPWLSTIAGSFEFYRFNSLRFRYAPRVGTSTLGNIVVATDYDSADTVPVGEQQMSAMKGAEEFAVWQQWTHVCPAHLLNRLYKAHPNMDDSRFASTSQDQKTIDAGQLFVGTDSVIGTLGKLWVDYDVTLINPQPVTLPPPNAGGLYSTSTTVSNTTTPYAAAPLTTTQADPLVAVQSNSLMYPTSTPYQVLKPFAGDVTSYATGTTLTGIAQPIAKRMINGVLTTILPTAIQNGIINSAGNQAMRLDRFDSLLPGDLLGSTGVTGAGLTSLLLDIGSRSGSFYAPPLSF